MGALSRRGRAAGQINIAPPKQVLATARTLRWAARNADVEGRTAHDLRRTFAQNVKRGGADDRTVAALLGQGSTRMAGVYSWPELDTMRHALENRKPEQDGSKAETRRK